MTSSSVSRHYTVGDLENRILGALEAAGIDLDQLTVDDLAPVDQFHIRGRRATEELTRWAQIEPTHRLLDVGSGLGGTGRYLAANVGCEVVGVDVTAEYCRVAEMLSARVGLSERTSFRHGSALELPFPDAHFDIVWTEHVQMNIADKTGFYGELTRVLKPGGRLAFHDVFDGSVEGLHLPVPWASEASISHLVDLATARAVLSDIGLAEIQLEDKTEASRTFFRSALERLRTHGWNPLGLHLLMGDDAATKFANLLRNLEEDRVRVVQAVVAATP